MSTVNCSRCGKPVSNEVQPELIVRAWVECPECLEAEHDNDMGEASRRVVYTPPEGSLYTGFLSGIYYVDGKQVSEEEFREDAIKRTLKKTKEMDEGWIISGSSRQEIHYHVGRWSLCKKWYMAKLFAPGTHDELPDSHYYQDGKSGVIHDMYFPDRTVPLILENICKRCLAKMTNYQKQEIRQGV